MAEYTKTKEKELIKYKKQLADFEREIAVIRTSKILNGVDGTSARKLGYALLYAGAYLRTAQEEIDNARTIAKERDDGT